MVTPNKFSAVEAWMDYLLSCCQDILQHYISPPFRERIRLCKMSGGVLGGYTGYFQVIKLR